MNLRHEGNRKSWNANAASWKAERDRDGLWRRCPTEPDLAFEGEALAQIKALSAPFEGKRAGVIGSGDNYAAFALAGLGLSVTSVDISENQLDTARERAAELGLDMEFVRADAAHMTAVPNASFDLVCSTNGFFVWIDDLQGVFGQVHRILRRGGHYVFYDIHPFQRPWKRQVEPLEMERDYWTTGPFEDPDDGTTEFHWTLGDLVNGLLAAGLQLVQVAESPPSDSRFWEGHSYEPGSDPTLQEWKRNPRAGLPTWLTVAVARP